MAPNLGGLLHDLARICTALATPWARASSSTHKGWAAALPGPSIALALSSATAAGLLPCMPAEAPLPCPHVQWTAPACC